MAKAVASEKLGGVGSKRRWQTPAAGAVGSCIEEEAPLDVGWRPVVSRAAADLTGRVSEAMTAGSRTPCAAASGPKWFSAAARLNVRRAAPELGGQAGRGAAQHVGGGALGPRKKSKGSEEAEKRGRGRGKKEREEGRGRIKEEEDDMWVPLFFLRVNDMSVPFFFCLFNSKMSHKRHINNTWKEDRVNTTM